jgi:hypothetical protein
LAGMGQRRAVEPYCHPASFRAGPGRGWPEELQRRTAPEKPPWINAGETATKRGHNTYCIGCRNDR